MDIKEAASLGGKRRIANMSAKQLSTANTKASKAAWRGHKKLDPKCACKRCVARRAKKQSVAKSN